MRERRESSPSRGPGGVRGARPGWQSLLGEMLRIVPGSGPVLLVAAAAPRHRGGSAPDRSTATLAGVERWIVGAFGEVWSPIAIQLVAASARRPIESEGSMGRMPKMLGETDAWPLATGSTPAIVVLPSAVRLALRDAGARAELWRTLADGGHLLCIGSVGWMVRGRQLDDCELRLRGRSVWSLGASERSLGGRGRASTWLQQADTLLAPRLAAFARGQALWLQHTTMRATPLRSVVKPLRAGRWASGLAVSRGPCTRNPLHRRDGK